MEVCGETGRGDFSASESQARTVSESRAPEERAAPLHPPAGLCRGSRTVRFQARCDPIRAYLPGDVTPRPTVRASRPGRFLRSLRRMSTQASVQPSSPREAGSEPGNLQLRGRVHRSLAQRVSLSCGTGRCRRQELPRGSRARSPGFLLPSVYARAGRRLCLSCPRALRGAWGEALHLPMPQVQQLPGHGVRGLRDRRGQAVLRPRQSGVDGQVRPQGRTDDCQSSRLRDWR
jgi:hypothetical protein